MKFDRSDAKWFLIIGLVGAFIVAGFRLSVEIFALFLQMGILLSLVVIAFKVDEIAKERKEENARIRAIIK